MRKLISALIISATLLSCGKTVTNSGSDKGKLSVSGSKGVNVSYQKSEDLILVIKDNSLSLVKGSLENGADPNYLSFEGERPLVVAAKIGNTEIVEKLLKKGADPMLSDAKGNLAIFEAIKHNNLGSFHAIVNKTQNINLLDGNKESALIVSLKNSNQSMSNALIKLGIDTLLKDKNGRRPIEIARAKGLKKSLSLLLDVSKIKNNGLDKNFIINTIKFSSKETLDYITNQYPVKEYLNGSNAITTVLNVHDIVDRSLMLEQLLNNKLSPNGEPKDTLIPLIEAVRLNDLVSAEYLIDRGADVNILDVKNSTPLFYAVRSLNYTMVNALVLKGALTEYEYTYNDYTYKKDLCKTVPKSRRRTPSQSKIKIQNIKYRLGC